MFRIFTLLFIFISIITVTQAQNIRSVEFGMSPSEVKQNEDANLVKEGDQDYLYYVMYRDDVGGYQALIAFIFAQDKLTRVRYSFTEEHTNRNLFIDDFNSIDKILIKKYGPPSELKNHVWSDDLYKDNRSDYGMALAVGHLAIQSSWETSGMKIFHTISGDNYNINHDIEYQSKQYKSLETKAKEEANLSDF